MDREALDRGQFKAQGGFNGLNKVFGGRLEQVLGDLREELFRTVLENGAWQPTSRIVREAA